MYLSLLVAGIISLIIVLKWDKMDYKEKILAGILILIVFSYTMNHYKNQQMEEAYENMNRSEVEIKSADFSDLNQEELQLLREEMKEVEEMEDTELKKEEGKEDMNNVTTIAHTATTTQPTQQTHADDGLVIPRDVNNQRQIENLERRLKTLNAFQDVTSTTSPQPTNASTDSVPQDLESESEIVQQNDGDATHSIFNPQIIFKEGDSGTDYNFNVKDNTLSVPIGNNSQIDTGSSEWNVPTHNLWSDSTNTENQRSGRIDVLNSGYNASYRNSTNRHNMVNSGNTGNTVQNGYETDGEQVDNNYQNSPKTYYPGYSYMPPSNWSVPQRRAPICVGANPDTTKLPIGIADHGTPINALEVDPIGRILSTEEKVKYTNVGSILPKFAYKEMSN